jgi:hypothetical protein
MVRLVVEEELDPDGERHRGEARVPSGAFEVPRREAAERIEQLSPRRGTGEARASSATIRATRARARWARFSCTDPMPDRLRRRTASGVAHDQGKRIELRAQPLQRGGRGRRADLGPRRRRAASRSGSGRAEPPHPGALEARAQTPRLPGSCPHTRAAAAASGRRRRAPQAPPPRRCRVPARRDRVRTAAQRVRRLHPRR